MHHICVRQIGRGALGERRHARGRATAQRRYLRGECALGGGIAHGRRAACVYSAKKRGNAGCAARRWRYHPAPPAGARAPHIQPSKRRDLFCAEQLTPWIAIDLVTRSCEVGCEESFSLLHARALCGACKLEGHTFSLGITFRRFGNSPPDVPGHQRLGDGRGGGGAPDGAR